MNGINKHWCAPLALALSLGFAADSAARSSVAGGSFTVTASVGSGEGAIDPPSQTVAAGDPANFFVIAQPDWAIDSVSGDTCTPADNGDGTWTAPNITANCDVVADFRQDKSSVAEFCSSPQVAIPDNAPAGIDATLDVPTAGELTAVRVRLQGQHTWVGDLIFDLVHPNGSTSVRLVDRPGVPATDFGCGAEDFDLWLDDGGADGAVESQCSPSPPALFGDAVPNEALAAFDGLAVGGEWTLTVSDNAGDDTGALGTWCLELTYLPETTPAYTVTPSAGPGGTIAPDTQQTVNEGETVQFELRAEEGFDIDGVSGSCGGSLSGDLFTTNPVLADCTVAASFAPSEYSVSAQVGEGQGSVGPASQNVEHGQSATLTVSPADGWRIEEVRGDTCTPADTGGGDWTAPNITADCQITVDFELITYTVTPTTFGGGGSISPATPQIVLPGSQVEFELTPSKTQEIDEVTGTCGGTLVGTTFTTSPVFDDCTVEGRFRTATFTVTAGASGDGTIDPASQTIDFGGSADFTVMAADGWELESVTGDTCSPVDIGSGSWRAENITADCDVTAAFRSLNDEVFEDRFEAGN